jgi:hypothetical protein
VVGGSPSAHYLSALWVRTAVNKEGTNGTRRKKEPDSGRDVEFVDQPLLRGD